MSAKPKPMITISLEEYNTLLEFEKRFKSFEGAAYAEALSIVYGVSQYKGDINILLQSEGFSIYTMAQEMSISTNHKYPPVVVKKL